MECKSAEYWVSLYLDGSLDEATEKLLLEHLDGCEYCNAYFEQAAKLHNAASELFEHKDAAYMPDSASIMEDIFKAEAPIAKSRSFMKPAVIAAALALIMMFIPINSKTVLAYVNDWVRNLMIRQPGLVMMVEDKATARTYEPSGGTTTYLQSEEQYLKTPEEVMNTAYKIEKKPCLPEFMPDGYVFDGASYGKYTNDASVDFYIQSYYIKQNDPSTQKDNISVRLSYSGPGVRTTGFKAHISEKEQAKELTAAGERGILIKRSEETGFISYKAYFILNKPNVKLQIQCRVKKDSISVESDIIKIAVPLLEKIKKEVPVEEIVRHNVSNHIESSDEKEFNEKITGLDDRIVKPGSLPEGYVFTQGIFIDNPKKIAPFSLSSNYYATYQKGDAKLLISMQLFTHTEKNADFDTYNFGEVVQRELLAGYIMKAYKGTAISVDMPDYAASITVRSTSRNDQILDNQALKPILLDIIESIKQKAAPRQILNLGRKIKVYDNLKQLADSAEIREQGFVIPSFIPTDSDFYNAKYVDDGYVLQFSRKLGLSKLPVRIQTLTTIEMRKSDMPNALPFEDEAEVRDIIVAGRNAYFISDTYGTQSGMRINEVKLQMDLMDKGMFLMVSQTFNADEEADEKEIIRIAESILDQIH